MHGLSILPDALLVTILSFLPTRVAARTSVLSRRFRHLWQTIPFVQLNGGGLRDHPDKFIAMADGVLLNRTHPLVSLRLDLDFRSPSVSDSYVLSLLTKALSLGLRHLTILGYLDSVPILPTIFSINSLQTLSLMLPLYPFPGRPQPYLKFPSPFTLPCLKSLSLGFCSADPASLTQLVSELCSLEDLLLVTRSINTLSLSSQSIKTLQLIIREQVHTIELFLPSLESLHLNKCRSFSSMFCIHGEFPLLKEAFIKLFKVHGEDVNAVSKLLNSFGHLEELTLYIKERERGKCPKPILLQPGKNLLKFPNLKHLDVSLCFHEHNFEAITMMIHNSPALESVKLVHEIPNFIGASRGRKR
ncbi:hypothetical protein LUZ63_012948 [Rhynchospora breviuscula]|uniref:F-box domain-containing protein n=1 Tax=Rhynchospora breviuscula TaxID=2022672 RepID=A0A9Q0C7L3_9POAL|nr:hypothetical protein LUZ63_012948 [Rhynchospora breviuscula]